MALCCNKNALMAQQCVQWQPKQCISNCIFCWTFKPSMSAGHEQELLWLPHSQLERVFLSPGNSIEAPCEWCPLFPWAEPPLGKCPDFCVACWFSEISPVLSQLMQEYFGLPSLLCCCCITRLLEHKERVWWLLAFSEQQLASDTLRKYSLPGSGCRLKRFSLVFPLYVFGLCHCRVCATFGWLLCVQIAHRHFFPLRTAMDN